MKKKINYDKSKFVTKQEAADIIEVCPQTIANFVERGMLSASLYHESLLRSSWTRLIRLSLPRKN